MKNMAKLIGIIAIVAVIGLGVVACGEDEEVKEEEITDATTAGKLTITGLTSINGKEIYAISKEKQPKDGSTKYYLQAWKSASNKYDPNSDYSSGDKTVKGKVESGQVVLKVFKFVGPGNGKNACYQSYSGSDEDVEFDITYDGGSGTVTVSFTNGVGSDTNPTLSP